jgi:hypothetical protein
MGQLDHHHNVIIIPTNPSHNDLQSVTHTHTYIQTRHEGRVLPWVSLQLTTNMGLTGTDIGILFYISYSSSFTNIDILAECSASRSIHLEKVPVLYVQSE